MKRIAITLYTLLTLIICTACSQEDDINEIFVGRTWYMNGATVNGMKLNSEISNFYTDAGDAAYYITFNSNTFQGALSYGTNFSGTWEANGKHQTIKLTFIQKPTSALIFDKDIEHILSAITSYKSGAEFLTLKQDGSNFINFSDSRHKYYN